MLIPEDKRSRITDDFSSFKCRVEDIEDLIEDLKQALGYNVLLEDVL
jgi:O-acetylhomoserine/O-acetylserine sulfhydrylase-like pyridoxal-dependent enzyme